MTDDAIRGMRTAYAADISVIDQAVGDIVGALERTGWPDTTWIIYTSDHGEMGGNHGLMSKCVLYEPAVRVPLIVRPPGRRTPHVVDALVEHLDVPATVRAIAGAPAVAARKGVRSCRTSATRMRRHLVLSPSARTGASPPSRPIGTNWSSTRTRWPRVSSSISPRMPPKTTISSSTPPRVGMVEEIMETHVRPFFRNPPSRPIPSFFTGGYDKLSRSHGESPHGVAPSWEPSELSGTSAAFVLRANMPNPTSG